jgi:hypothetical protein
MLGFNHGKTKFTLIDIAKTLVRRQHFPPYNILSDRWVKVTSKLQNILKTPNYESYNFAGL